MHCEQGLSGGGAQSASNINGRRPSDYVKESDIVLSFQSSSLESNTVQDVGFDLLSLRVNKIIMKGFSKKSVVQSGFCFFFGPGTHV